MSSLIAALAGFLLAGWWNGDAPDAQGLAGLLGAVDPLAGAAGGGLLGTLAMAFGALRKAKRVEHGPSRAEARVESLERQMAETQRDLREVRSALMRRGSTGGAG